MWKYVKENKGKIGGGFVGFLIALFIIIAWPIILIIFLIFLGILLGAIFDMIGRGRKWLEKSKIYRKSNKKD